MKRACFVATLGILGFLTADCDPSPGSVLLVTGPSSIATPAGQLSPSPIVLSPFRDARCPDAVNFGASFHLIVTAGSDDLTLDHMTIHMLDGTNLGGPEITIPSSEFTPRATSLSIFAGTTRDFALRPTFGCFAARPRMLRGSAFLFDRRGTPHTVVLEGRIQ